MKGEGKLQFKACAKWGGKWAKEIGEWAEDVGRIVAGDLRAAPGIVSNHPALGLIKEFLLKDPQEWVTYGLAMMRDGQFLGSAGQSVEWYVATHKSSCSGERTTTTRTAQLAAVGLGAVLASPTVRELNPQVDVASIHVWYDTLRSEHLRGLEPIIGSILDGFQNANQAWHASGIAPEVAAAGIARLRDRKIANKFGGAKKDRLSGFGALRDRKAAAKFGGNKTETPLGLIAAGAVGGFLVAGPAGAVVGGILGSLIDKGK